MHVVNGLKLPQALAQIGGEVIWSIWAGHLYQATCCGRAGLPSSHVSTLGLNPDKRLIHGLVLCLPLIPSISPPYSSSSKQIWGLVAPLPTLPNHN